MSITDCIENAAVKILEPVSPDPLELWEKSGATIDQVEIEPGRTEFAPTYDKSVSRILRIEHIGDCEDVVARGETIGSKQRFLVEMSTGISHQAAIYFPTQQHLDMSQVTIHMDTPWMTGVGGHNDKIAEAFMHYTHQPVVLVGPEEMRKHENGLYVAKNLGSVATEASQISLALAAQDSMQIAAEITEMYGVSRMFVQVGESRAGMLAPAKELHAANLDIKNIYYDLTDPSVPDNLTDDAVNNIIRLLEFMPNEMLHILPVGIDLARRKSLHRLLGTIPLNAEYMAASLFGTSRAIGSGEAGEFPKLLGSSAAVHVANFKHNPLAQHARWREKYRHTKFAGVDLEGSHLGLAYSSVQRHVIERINRLLYELYLAGGDESKVDFRRVHLTDDKKYLDKNEHMPAVA